MKTWEVRFNEITQEAYNEGYEAGEFEVFRLMRAYISDSKNSTFTKKEVLAQLNKASREAQR